MHALALANYYNNNKTAQHKSSAKNNYYTFNAVNAYVKHTVNLRAMQQAYNTLTATNCANTRNARVALYSAINVACNKQNYAYKHKNFCVQQATQQLCAYYKAA
jgi:hypothetical protein